MAYDLRSSIQITQDAFERLFLYIWSMSKILCSLLLLCFSFVGAQRQVALDSFQLKGVKEMQLDDYGNFYLYKTQDFSLTKTDSTGKILGRLMMTVPFRLQNVQNPLSIMLFSENAQELKVIDQNLNEIQKIDFRLNFGFIKAAYAEDLQQIWLLEESSRRLIQYNFRNQQVINSFPLTLDFSDVNSMVVFNQKLYLISSKAFHVYDFKGNQLVQKEIPNLKKIKRENERILLFTPNEIYTYTSLEGISEDFSKASAEIVDKNSASYFEYRANKVYLYEINQ